MFKKRKRTYSGSTSHEQQAGDEISIVLSLFYGIFVVSFAVVCIVSQYIATVGPFDISEYYLNTLYLISILWFLCFGMSVKWGCNRSDVKVPVKSYQASNRWLKGVVALFGLSITIKDALELVALTNIENPFCDHKFLYLLMTILHIPYVFGQVTFLFLFAKHHIQNCRHLSRFGIMHIMATNLSVWIASVAKEATEALAYENQNKNVRFNRTTEADDETNFSTNVIIGTLFQGNCTCSTALCSRVLQSEQFLFPFLIEFCLISTCLLYESWRNIGKTTSESIIVVQPHYKLYKAYKGPTLGALVLASTVTIVVVLGSTEEWSEKSSYKNQYSNLNLYETFLIVCELINLLVCCLCFYLYFKLKKRTHLSPYVTLDIGLLFVCFIGPVLSGLFSILCLSLGLPATKAPGWIISLLYPIIDIIGSTVQILLLVYGLQQIEKSNSSSSLEKLSLSQVEDEAFLKEESFRQSIQRYRSKEVMSTSNLKLPESNIQANSKAQVSYSSQRQSGEDKTQPRNLVARFRLSVPVGKRIILRDVIMFLMLSNASLWIFLSLDKTVFLTLTYQYEYYGHSIWTILTAVTNPLSIFLRMHSAACFFEMWAYA